jgi:hypothetical protein
MLHSGAWSVQLDEFQRLATGEPVANLNKARP